MIKGGDREETWEGGKGGRRVEGGWRFANLVRLPCLVLCVCSVHQVWVCARENDQRVSFITGPDERMGKRDESCCMNLRRVALGSSWLLIIME